MKQMFSLLVAVALPVCNMVAVAEQADSVQGMISDALLRAAPDRVVGAGAVVPSYAGGDAGVYIPGLFYEKIYGGDVPSANGLSVNPDAVRIPATGYVPGVAVLRSWGSGGVYATGGRQSLVGLMGIETGTLNFGQRVGAFTLSLFGSATKYGYLRGLSTSYGFGGSISYDINEHFGITVFGAYHSATGINQAAMTGYVSAPTFGGYIDWRISSHWGVKAGAQSYRSIAYGRWETQPIVMPYYRTSGGAEIGLDVGGILYQIVRSASGKNRMNQGNPTIDPRPSGVYVRPRD